MGNRKWLNLVKSQKFPEKFSKTFSKHAIICKGHDEKVNQAEFILFLFFDHNQNI